MKIRKARIRFQIEYSTNHLVMMILMMAMTSLLRIQVNPKSSKIAVTMKKKKLKKKK